MDNNENIFDNEKLNDICQKVVNGEITSTAGLNLTLDELFTKDKNGDFLLIDLLENNVDIDLENEKIRNNGSVFFYFLIYGQDISQFSYDKIDYTYGENGNMNVLNYLLEEYDLSINDLLIKDKNGTTLLEQMLKENIDISNIDIDDDIMDLEKIIKIIDIITYKDNEVPEKIKNIFENTLFSTNNNEFFKNLVMKDILLFEKMIGFIVEHTEIVDLLCKYHLEYHLRYLNPEIIKKLITKDENGNYPIDKYVSNSMAIKNISSLINFDENIDFMIHFIKLLVDNKLYSFFYDADENILLYKVYPPKTLLETLIENNVNIKVNNINNKEIIKILYDNKKLDLIGSNSENIWLSNTRDVFKDTMVKDQTVLEYMIDNNYDIKISNIFEDDTLKILYQKNRLDLLVIADATILMTKINDNYTYLDYILDCINKGDFEYNIDNITAPIKPDMKAEFYLDIARHDMIGYVKNSLNLNTLLKKYDNKTLLDYFLDKDPELTLNKILDKSDKMNYSVMIILKSRSIKDNDSILNINKDNASFVKNTPDTYYGPLDNDSDYLIKELERLFISDGKSDKDLINLLITGYRNALFINYDITIREIEKLIKIKKNNFDKFYYVKDKDSSYFSPNNGCILMNGGCISTIIHETGHALHYYLTELKVPDNYDEIVKRVRENNELLTKTSKYFEHCNKIMKNIKNYFLNFANEVLTAHYSKQENIMDIQGILSKDIDKYRDKFKSLKIPEEQLEQILQETFSVEEYIKREAIIVASELTDTTIRNNYASIGATNDIIDAIYRGKVCDGVLKSADGQKIASFGGHGIRYYSQNKHGFDEMIAQFAVLVKFKGAEENLQVLRNIVGDEIYNMISNFYYTNILEMDINKSKNQGGR
ncbi:MAG: hypothetical protein UCL21_03810 [Bacilli bacterium]|nr:hypothetical protein [Bacilli bacterium]